jgi:hypothetical protein
MSQIGGTLSHLTIEYHTQYDGALVNDVLKIHDKTLRSVSIDIKYNLDSYKPMIAKVIHCFKEKPLIEFNMKV